MLKTQEQILFGGTKEAFDARLEQFRRLAVVPDQQTGAFRKRGGIKVQAVSGSSTNQLRRLIFGA